MDYNLNYNSVYIIVYISVAVLLCAAAVLNAVKLAKKSKVPGMFEKAGILLVCGIILLIIEIFKQVYLNYTRSWDYSWSDLPFQLCSIPMYLCIIYGAWSKSPRNTFGNKSRGKAHGNKSRGKAHGNKTVVTNSMEAFLMTFGFLGGLMTLVDPANSFSPYPLLIMHSILWHVILIFIALYLWCCRGVRPEKSKEGFSWRGFIGASLMYITLAVAAVIINASLSKVSNGTCNMFFIGPAFPCVAILNDIYKQFGWVLESVLFVAVTLISAGGVWWIGRRVCYNRLTEAS